MSEINVSSQLSETETESELQSCSFSVVTALDRLLDYLIARAPAEGVCQDIPLAFSEMRALRTIPVSGCIPMHQLATAMGVPVSTATRVVDRLVTKGLAARIRSESDRRLVLVELGEPARAARQSAFTRHVGLIQQILEPLSPAAREQVVHVFDQIAHAARSQPPALPPIQPDGPIGTPEPGKRS